MQNSVLINAGIVSALFLVFKFIEMRIVTKENIPPKQLLRDAILVFLSFVLSHYLLKQFGGVTGKKFVEVFTDGPSF